MIHFQRLIYTLKIQYGTILDIYRESNKTINVETGRVHVTRTKYHIRQAVVLPTAIGSESPFLRRANLLFKQSGQEEVDKRDIIIDRRDIPIIPNVGSDYIIYKAERYGIEKLNMIDNAKRVFGYHLVIVKVKTELAYEQHNEQINDRLFIGDSFINESNADEIDFDLQINDELVLTQNYIQS